MSEVHEPLTVVVADDHAPTRAGVKVSLEADGFVVVAEASTAKGAVQAAVEHRPHVCVLDIHMPGSGIAAAEQISREVPDTAVVMLTYSRESEDLFDALRAGARGFLIKDMDPDRLGSALRGVLNGEAALPRSLVSKVIEEFRGRSSRKVFMRQRRGADLTSREWEIMELLRQGLSTEDVAGRLFVSPRTVDFHLRNVFTKLQLTSRAELAALPLED